MKIISEYSERKERIMNKYITAPIDKTAIESLKAGDYVYISGIVYTARDAAHKRMYEILQKKWKFTD